MGTSFESLILNKLYYEAKTEQIDKGKELIPVYNNSLNQETMQIVANKSDSTDDYQLQHNNRLVFEGISFLSSPGHPSFKSRAELAQECIDIRKAQENASSSELKKDMEEENFIFRDFVAAI